MLISIANECTFSVDWVPGREFVLKTKLHSLIEFSWTYNMIFFFPYYVFENSGIWVSKRFLAPFFPLKTDYQTLTTLKQ